MFQLKEHVASSAVSSVDAFSLGNAQYYIFNKVHSSKLHMH